MRYDLSEPPNERHEFRKNYVLGSQTTVNVGEAMVRVQDYWVESTESSVAVPERSVSLKGGLVDVTLTAGAKYPVKGRANIDGKDLTVAAFEEGPLAFRAVLLNADGTLHNRIVTSNIQANGFGSLKQGDGLIPVVYTLTISDPSVRLLREKVDTVKVSKGYENYEIIYTGTNGNALNLTYREFSPDGLARVAFFQNLTYEASARNITFKKIKISVLKSGSDSITFTVLEDGYDAAMSR
jgi:hypothetical protein